MKKLLSSILIITMFATPVLAQSFGNLGKLPFFGWLGWNSSISTTTYDLTSAFTYESGGTSVSYRFVSPVTQTDAPLTCYPVIAGVVGTNLTLQMDVYPGAGLTGDDDRPLASSTSLGAANGQTFDGTTTPTYAFFRWESISLNKGSTTWLVMHNTSADPISNYFTVAVRRNNVAGSPIKMTTYTNADGFLTDPTGQSSDSPIVCKFADGTLMGNPYAVTNAHASNQNFRGARFNFAMPTVMKGVCIGFTMPATTTLYVYQGSTELNKTVITDRQTLANTGCIYFESDVPFSADTDYDVLIKPPVNNTGGAYGYVNINNVNDDIYQTVYTTTGQLDGAATSSLTYIQGAITSFVPIISYIASSTGGTTGTMWGIID